MKKEVKKLFDDFPNLIELLIDLRKNQELSYKDTFGKEKEFIHLFEDIVRTV